MSVQACACEPTRNHKLKRKLEICQAERLSGCRQSFSAAFGAILFVFQWVFVCYCCCCLIRRHFCWLKPHDEGTSMTLCLYCMQMISTGTWHTHTHTRRHMCSRVCVRLLLIVLKFLSPNQFGLLCHLQMAHCLPVFFQHGFLFIFVFFLMRKLLAAA